MIRRRLLLHRLRINLANETTKSNDTASAANTAMTQREFNSSTGYATDYKFRASDIANLLTLGNISSDDLYSLFFNLLQNFGKNQESSQIL